MFTLCIRLIGMMLLFFLSTLPQTAAADCPNAFSGQSSMGNCNAGNGSLTNNQTGTSFGPCGSNAPPLGGVYGPSTGTENGGVYEPPRGTSNGGVYEPSTGTGGGDASATPSGSSVGVATLGCPIGGSVGAWHNLPINPRGRPVGTSNRNLAHTETPANDNRTSNNRTSSNRTSNIRTSSASNNSARFRGVRPSHARI
jgi:hypothetical protein